MQGSLDDDSPAENGVPEPPDNDLRREDLRGGNEVEDDVAQEDTEYFDSFSTTYSGRNRELVGRSAPFMNSLRDDMAGGDGILPFPPEAPVPFRPGSRGQDHVHPSGNFGTHEDRYSLHLEMLYQINQCIYSSPFLNLIPSCLCKVGNHSCSLFYLLSGPLFPLSLTLEMHQKIFAQFIFI